MWRMSAFCHVLYCHKVQPAFVLVKRFKGTFGFVSPGLLANMGNLFRLEWKRSRMGGKGIRTGPLEWNLRVGADRIDYQESGNMPGYVRANVPEARFFSECV